MFDRQYINPSDAPAPRISVILPTFNNGKYLRRAIQSCLDQDPRPYEVIVVDDGSTDDTGAVLASFRSESRVKMVRQGNKGTAAARNAGAAITSGDYLCFLDADDEYASGTFSARYRAIAGHPEVDIFFSDFQLSDAPGAMRGGFEANGGIETLERYFTGKSETVARLSKDFAEAYANRNVSPPIVHVNCVTMKRSFFDVLHGFNESCLVTEDIDLWTRSLSTGSAAVILNDVGATYFRWRGSTEKYEIAADRMISILQERLRSAPILSARWRAVRKLIAKEYISLIYCSKIGDIERKKAVSFLCRSAASYPLPGMQLKYAFLILLPRPLLRRLYAMRS